MAVVILLVATATPSSPVRCWRYLWSAFFTRTRAGRRPRSPGGARNRSRRSKSGAFPGPSMADGCLQIYRRKRAVVASVLQKGCKTLKIQLVGGLHCEHHGEPHPYMLVGWAC